MLLDYNYVCINVCITLMLQLVMAGVICIVYVLLSKEIFKVTKDLN